MLIDNLSEGAIETNLSPFLTSIFFRILKNFLFLFCSLIPVLSIFFTYSYELPSNAGNSGELILTIALSIFRALKQPLSAQ